MARRAIEVARYIYALSLLCQTTHAIPHRRFANTTSTLSTYETLSSTTTTSQILTTQALNVQQTDNLPWLVNVSYYTTDNTVAVTVLEAPETASGANITTFETLFNTSTETLRANTNAVAISSPSMGEAASSSVVQLTTVTQASLPVNTHTRATPTPPAHTRMTPTPPTFSLPSLSPSTLTPLTTSARAGIIKGTTMVSTELDTAGRVTSGPILSFSSSEVTPTASVISSLLTKSAVALSAPASNNTLLGVDPFQAIATAAPPAQLTQTGNHPVPTAAIIAPQNATLQTNKFYANLYLGSEEQSVFTLPYTLNWVNGSGGTKSYGMAVQHADRTSQVNGPSDAKIPTGPVSYYTNPLGSQQIVLTAKELGSQTELTVDSLDTFSVNVNLSPSRSGSTTKRQQTAKITFPLVQGMGFVTAIYTSLQPEIQTAGAFTNVTSAGSIGTAYKYRLSLNDGSQWLIYAIPEDTKTATEFTLTTNSLLQGPENWSGTIQVAKNTANVTTEGLYDISAGAYPTSASISGAVNGGQGEYSLSWNVVGQNLNNGIVLGFALPHMAQSFDGSMNNTVHKELSLQTPTKGTATAVMANKWNMVENSLPTAMTFTPWSPDNGTATAYSADAVNAIYAAAQLDLSQDMEAQTNSDSMYYAGKALSKFASILIAVNDICQEQDLAQQGLARLQDAFAMFVNNTQKHPLVYDTVWKGVVSSASYSGDSGADFGNTFYNDHHFHYGYFLHAAAVIAHLDPSWLSTGSNRDWVNSLARDVSNPNSQDSFYPVFRYFDWYQGHSWAHGLYETADGKDQESSSEDVMFSYGLKLWGVVTGDKSMEARGNLMLAVQARSLQSYFLLEDDNVNQPADFIGNKATGILFENKVDHTTYFGTNLEYTQGIHMLPLIPASALTRTSTFVQQEWDTYFADNATDPASQVQGGWKGVLYANLALTNPKASYQFFSDPSFDSSWLDGGASLTWYLAFAAGLGGASAAS